MGHEIAGFAGRLDVLSRLRERWRDCRLFHLARSKEFAFLPVPDWEEVEKDELAGKSVPNDFALASDFVPGQIEAFAAYSKGAALAWVKTDYFGGRGCQDAVLWADGAHVFGPLEMWSDAMAERPPTEWPINRALRGIGVAHDGGRDEFEMFGLGGYRRYADIAAEATLISP